jgi:hypothetical protein
VSPVLVNPSRFAVAGGGAGYSTEVLADSPLAYYRLAETSGTTLVDASGNSRNGAYGGTAYTLNQSGATSDGDPAVKFFGTHLSTVGYASVPSAAWMDVTSAITLECWLYSLSPGGGVSSTGGGGIFGRWANGSSINAGMLWVSNAEQLGAIIKIGGTNRSLTTGTYPPTAWTHVAVTYNGTTMILYINGASASTLSVTGAITTGTCNLDIGAYTSGSWPLQNHYVDECAMYGTALSATRIAAHYAAR